MNYNYFSFLDTHLNEHFEYRFYIDNDIDKVRKMKFAECYDKFLKGVKAEAEFELSTSLFVNTVLK